MIDDCSDNGYFYSAINNVYFDSNLLVVSIDLSICVSSHLKHSSEFDAGEISKYYPHINVTGPADGVNSVYEAICAHERGHAICFFSKIILDLYMSLALDADKYKNNPTSLETFVAQQFALATALHAEQSGIYANTAVYDWFAGDSTWRAVSVNSNDWSIWVKKGE